MSGECRRSPIGKKFAEARLAPDDPAPLQICQLVLYANQDRSWTGTRVTVQVDCPGLLRNLNTDIENNRTTRFAQAAGGVVGNYKGTARFFWPNGQKLVVNFFYSIAN